MRVFPRGNFDMGFLDQVKRDIEQENTLLIFATGMNGILNI